MTIQEFLHTPGPDGRTNHELFIAGRFSNTSSKLLGLLLAVALLLILTATVAGGALVLAVVALLGLLR